MLQLIVSSPSLVVVSEVQGIPLPAGAGLLQLRDLDLDPPPHVFEQMFHASQVPQVPLASGSMPKMSVYETKKLEK